MFLLIAIAILSGLLTIFSPCIWSILPIIFSSALQKTFFSRLSFVIGLITSYTIFTLLISFVIKVFHLSPDTLRITSVIILVISGLLLIFPHVWALIEMKINRATIHIHSTYINHNVINNFFTGLSLGVLWTPCNGPIMTTIAILAANQLINIATVLIALAYGLGVGISLLIAMSIEHTVIQHHSFLAAHTPKIQKLSGVAILIMAVLMYTNYDKLIAARVLAILPIHTSSYSSFENTSLAQKELTKLRERLRPNQSSTKGTETVPITPIYQSSLPYLGPAQEIKGITKWLNSSPLTLKTLHGKVILLDFWSYTCTACLPSIPQKNRWIKEYKNFVIIALHVPSTAEAKSEKNIQNAIKQYDIQYPVGIDSNFVSLDLYQTNVLPSEYLIDYNGQIRYVNKDGNAWQETEQAIQEVLREIGSY